MTKTRDLLQILFFGLKKVHGHMVVCAPVHHRRDYQRACRVNRHG
ncbi:hypothetical protein [Mariprofundus ferrooxydans]|nr:hypothetical protein [Mariprofundus ferrooxydans]